MLSLLKQNSAFLGSMITYTGANLINAALPFLLLPLLTTYLSTSDYGILSNITTFIAVLIPIIGFNLEAAVARHYVNTQVHLPSFIGSALKIILIALLSCTAILFGLGKHLEEITKIPLYIQLILPFYAVCHVSIEVILVLFRMQDKPVKYGIFRIVRTALELSLSILLIFYWKNDWTGRFAAIFLSTLIFALIAGILLVKNHFELSNSSHYRKKIISFGLPLIPHALGGAIFLYSDKLIITHFLGIDQNGVYTVAFQIGMVIALFQNSFNQAWTPWFYKKLAGNYTPKKIVNFTYLYCIALLVICLFLWIFTPFIFKLIGKDFQDGQPYVIWVGLGYAFNGMYKMFVNYLFYTEKTKWIATITLSSAGLNILLNFLFIPEYGLLGAAISSTVAFFFQFILSWILSYYAYPMPWLKRSDN